MIKILSCSDVRIIELVKIKMKKTAWEWFQIDMEDRLYSGNPPSWEEFKEAIMDEFILPAVRQNRALQFERLKQTLGVSVAEYVESFLG